MTEYEKEQIRKAQREYKREWRKKRPEYDKEYMREWRKNNPEKVQATHNRYWLKKAAEKNKEGGNNGE